MFQPQLNNKVNLEDIHIKVASFDKKSGAESMMLEAQLLVAKDFDEQMRHAGERIRFLGNVKKTYRDKIANIQNFLAQNQNLSRKDGKKYIDASFLQAADLYSNMTYLEYDLVKMTTTETGLKLNDNGDNHSLDQPFTQSSKALVPLNRGKIDVKDLMKAFTEGTKINNQKEAVAFAKKFGSDNTDLPFYFGHVNNTDENGFPQFAVFVEPLSNMIEQLKNKLTDVEEDSEKLSVTLNQISTQRKAALDGLNQLVGKMEQIRQHALSQSS